MFGRQSETEHEQGRDTESKAGSSLWSVSTEPNAGLEPTNCEIITWAKVGHSTDWTAQAPLNSIFKRKAHTYTHTKRLTGRDSPGDCKQGKAGVTTLMAKYVDFKVERSKPEYICASSHWVECRFKWESYVSPLTLSLWCLMQWRSYDLFPKVGH